jgi:hypothetical protein
MENAKCRNIKLGFYCLIVNNAHIDSAVMFCTVAVLVSVMCLLDWNGSQEFHPFILFWKGLNVSVMKVHYQLVAVYDGGGGGSRGNVSSILLGLEFLYLFKGISHASNIVCLPARYVH